MIKREVISGLLPWAQWTVALALLTLFITACQAPTTMAPPLTEAEIRAEQAEQERIVAEARARGMASSTPKTDAEMRRQFERVARRVAPAGEEICRAMAAPNPRGSCSFRFGMSPEKGINAHADGTNVIVYQGMMQIMQSDDELAAILAHELAHNIMGHVDATQQNVAVGGIVGTLIDQFAASRGIETGGQLGEIGAQAALLRYSTGFEQEADYVGLYIMARAGYDLGQSPDIWRRLAVVNPDGIYTSVTHPSYSQRYVAQQKTIAEINDKRNKGVALLPEFRQSAMNSRSSVGTVYGRVKAPSQLESRQRQDA